MTDRPQDLRAEPSACAGLPWLALCVMLSSVCALAVLGLGCEAKQDPGPQVVGSNSNWLRACASIDDCEDIPECACGVCTAGCTTDDDCAPLRDARCVLDGSPAARSVCESEQASGTQSRRPGICLPRCEPGECGQGQACASGACVLAAFPDNAFCDAVTQADDAERAREDELLALLQMQRAADTQQCPDAAAPSAGPQPAFRFDARLTCAARVLAHDIATTGALSLTDSEDRGTEQRIGLADYNAQLWNESFALDAQSAQEALELILQQVESCATILGPAAMDIGVANVGDVYVVTLGTQ